MKDMAPASSEFAKKKTIQQQRQYLPVFAVREEVILMLSFNFYHFQFLINFRSDN